MKTKFHTLMFLNNFVDVNQLEKGIYETEKPILYPENETIESLIDRARMMKTITGETFLSDAYFENLSKCYMADANLTITDKVKQENESNVITDFLKAKANELNVRCDAVKIGMKFNYDKNKYELVITNENNNVLSVVNPNVVID